MDMKPPCFNLLISLGDAPFTADALLFSSIKDSRLPKGLLEHLAAGLVILFAEDAFPADGMVSAFVTYLPGVDEKGNVFHDKTECLSHGFAQRPSDSSQGLGCLQGHFRGIGHIATSYAAACCSGRTSFLTLERGFFLFFKAS